MVIVAFNFSKINVEKKSSIEGKININNNVVIKDVVESDLSLGTEKQKAVKFMFEFTSKYEPDYASIYLGGDITTIEDSQKAKKIVEDWKKNGKVEKALMENILNSILTKCNIQALILSQDVNLPSPIPLPKVRQEPEAKK